MKVTRNDRFLELIGLGVGAKLHAQLGDRARAIDDLRLVVDVASALRDELVSIDDGSP